MNLRFHMEKDWHDMQARYLNSPYATAAELNRLCQATGNRVLPVAANSEREELLCAYILKKEKERPPVKAKPKGRSLNPTVEDLERRFKRTGQRPADLFPKGWDLAQYLELVTDKKNVPAP